MISDTFHHCQIRPDDICNLSGRRIILHLCDVWNILDYLCFILYIFAFSLHVLAIPNLLVHIRRLYSVSLFVMFLRAFNLLLLFKRLGIIIIMVKEMVRLTPISIISMTILLTQTILKKKNSMGNCTYLRQCFSNIDMILIWKKNELPNNDHKCRRMHRFLVCGTFLRWVIMF